MDRTIDREKVIKGLETIKQFFGYGLPSTAELFDSYYGILNDAIAILKEQELVEPYSMNAERTYGICPKCGKIVFRYGNVEENHYCGVCGQAVKWE